VRDLERLWRHFSVEKRLEIFPVALALDAMGEPGFVFLESGFRSRERILVPKGVDGLGVHFDGILATGEDIGYGAVNSREISAPVIATRGELAGDGFDLAIRGAVNPLDADSLAGVVGGVYGKLDLGEMLFELGADILRDGGGSGIFADLDEVRVVGGLGF
jgi:hypothetical protein